jgi:hypothetical protein
MVTVGFPAPGIPDTITHPNNSPEVMGPDTSNGFAAQQLIFIWVCSRGWTTTTES